MPERRVVFHLHCYQPPRESPWTGAVLREPSAAPFHDWNERITAECYRPLSAARVLDADGLVAAARNLYRDVSFNVGPTLHGWLADHAPDVDSAVRGADRAERSADPRHGPAIAQPYVHAILPLATDRDRTTLVRWGIADFRRRFGRAPKGMWLPETAVDIATLECLADHDVAFTILAPQQSARVREAGGIWQAAPNRLDPSRPYRVKLPSGRAITVVFFDGPLSQAVAFDRALLDDGARLVAAVADRARLPSAPHLVVVATDGETFGHHHRFGEMALARAVGDLGDVADVVVGGLAGFLDAHPATFEVELVSPSSWSCVHGVERWRADCGDVTGGQPHWNQRWRAPLRAALDEFAHAAAEVYEAAAGRVVDDPWALRDAYGDVIRSPPPERIAFAERNVRTPRPHGATSEHILGLLEFQRHVLFAFSSCAWFFADCAGLETRLSLQHASRAVELAHALTGMNLAPILDRGLAPMQSNDPATGGGRAIWRDARRASVDLSAAAAWWASRAVVGPATARLGRLTVRPRAQHLSGDPGATAVLVATVDVIDEATLAKAQVDVVAVAWDGRLTVGVADPGAFATLVRDDGPLDASRAAQRARVVAATARRGFTLATLPGETRADVLVAWWHAMADAAEPPRVTAVRRLYETTRAVGPPVDPDLVEAVVVRTAPEAVAHAKTAPVGGLAALRFVVDVVGASLPPDVEWAAQNAVLRARDRILPSMRGRAASDARAKRWVYDFENVAAALRVAVSRA